MVALWTRRSFVGGGHSFAAALSGPFAATGTVLRISEALGPWRLWTGLSHEASDERLGVQGGSMRVKGGHTGTAYNKCR